MTEPAATGAGGVLARDSPWAAVAVGLGVAWPAQSRFALAVRADALVHLVRPQLHLEGPERVSAAFRMPALGFRALAGPLVRFP